MRTTKGPGIFLAQFAGDAAPFNRLESICAWAANLGYKGVQIPSWDARLFDLRRAVEQLLLAAKASANLGLAAHVTFSGALAWPYFYPWPQRPAGLIKTAFEELAARWRPILDAFDKAGVDLCFEIHPGEDLHDGATFEMFLERVGNHPRCNVLYDPSHFVLQQLDYLEFIDLYHERIKMFHVKDAEFRPTGRQGIYKRYQPWINRAGRFRSPGDGQVDFGA